MEYKYIKTKTTHYIDYNDFNKLVNECMKNPKLRLDCAVMFEWSNDSTYTTTIRKNRSDYETPLNQIEEFFESPRQWLVDYNDLLWYIAYKGRIPYGDYVIEVSW